MILVFAEHQKGQFKKSVLEAVWYASKIAQLKNTTVNAVVLGEVNDMSILGNYGANKITHINDARLNNFNTKAYSKAIGFVANQQDAKIIVFSNTTTAKSVTPRLSAYLHAGLASGIISLPDENFYFKKNVFSGKAIALVNIKTEKKIIAINPNSFAIEKTANNAVIETMSVDFTELDLSVKKISEQHIDGVMPLGDATLVVSGGRGLKGPENWGMLEELASSLGAALACSRPVADSHWRPHHEHVGQTGGTIKPNLYIAVGISGSIQHLAGVNSSKVIVVINKDIEAPFFKAADYGVLGDAFEIIPKLNIAVKKFKSL